MAYDWTGLEDNFINHPILTLKEAENYQQQIARAEQLMFRDTARHVALMRIAEGLFGNREEAIVIAQEALDYAVL